MTAAKMVLHDWQRGKIPFFVPPPKQEETQPTEPEDTSVSEKDVVVDDNKDLAAKRIIQNIVSSQQLKDVPVQEDLFTETELKGDDANKEEGS